MLRLIALSLAGNSALVLLLPGAGRSSELTWLGLIVLGLAGLALCTLLLRSAFAPLVFESLRLQETAIGWERSRLLSSPPGGAPDSALAAVTALRRRLADDLVESQSLRERAQEASEFKTAFLKSVQHELRTPLNAILGFADVLLSGIEGPLSATQRENLVVIRSTGKRLQDLFDEVIDLTTVAGQGEPQRTATDLGRLIEDIREALESQRGQRAVHVRVEHDPAVPLVLVDAAHLRRLWLGVAGSVFSLAQGAEVELSATTDGDFACLRVRDPARRLDDEELHALLGTDRSRLRRKGLDESHRLRIALWREHAQLLGGRFELTSDERGTTFALRLPSTPSGGGASA